MQAQEIPGMELKIMRHGNEKYTVGQRSRKPQKESIKTLRRQQALDRAQVSEGGTAATDIIRI